MGASRAHPHLQQQQQRNDEYIQRTVKLLQGNPSFLLFLVDDEYQGQVNEKFKLLFE